MPVETPRGRPARVVFAGGKAVGCGCLRSLLETNAAEVAAVFVNPGDTAAGRWYPSVAEVALEHGLPVFAPASINQPGEVARIRDLDPDLMMVAYYDQILHPPVFELPRMGSINLHLALAEEYRGCYPTTWALINGETRTGATLHYITANIDGGDIIAQSEVPIAVEDTGRSLYDKCTESGVALFRENLPAILTGGIKRRPQVATEKTKYHKRRFPDHEIHFEGDAKSVYDRIRALHFPPFPPPYFYIGKTKMVIVEEPEVKR